MAGNAGRAGKEVLEGLIKDFEQDLAELKPAYDSYKQVEQQLKQLRKVLNPPPPRTRKPKATPETASPAQEPAPANA